MNLLQYSLFVILYFFLPSILISNIEQGIKNKEVGKQFPQLAKPSLSPPYGICFAAFNALK